MSSARNHMIFKKSQVRIQTILGVVGGDVEIHVDLPRRTINNILGRSSCGSPTHEFDNIAGTARRKDIPTDALCVW